MAQVVLRCFATLRQLRRSLPATTIQTLVVALVLNRHDYANSTLAGLPTYLVRRRQSVLNASARLIYRLGGHAHITDALISGPRMYEVQTSSLDIVGSSGNIASLPRATRPSG
jgi:hypothetical protein